MGRGIEQQLDEVGGRHVRDEGQGGGGGAAGDLLVDEEAADADGQEAQGVELAQAVAQLEADDAEEVRRDHLSVAPAAASAAGERKGKEEPREEGGRRRGAVHVGLEEGHQVGARLAHDEVVHVEELRDAHQRRLAVLLRRVGPGAEGLRCRPWHHPAVGVLAEHRRLPAAVERGRRGVRCHCCCPDELCRRCVLAD